MICGDARRAAAAVIAIAVAAAAGCSSSGGQAADAAGGPCLGCDAAAPDGRVRCDRTEDCADGQMCVEGMCVAAVRGNGTIEPGEQCDDANTTDLDGCDAEGRYELFMRSYQVVLTESPAGSFCTSPKSALADALNVYALAANNAARKTRIDSGLEHSIFQIVGMTDLTGASAQTIDIRLAEAVLDPARGTWPAGEVNPIDWWVLMQPASLDAAGEIGDEIAGISVSGGSFAGGPGTTGRPVPQFVDISMRAHFETSDPDRPAPPPEELADDLRVVREVVADGSDEGICGALTVAFLAATPAEASLDQCLECPGTSHSYRPCSGPVVDDSCNSGLDALVGGCVIGADCEAGTVFVEATQPDVLRGGPLPLVADPDNFHKIPRTQTEGNLDGYSTYFKFRARRVHVTGVAE
jgi:cysteine-rich repeat protein